MQIHGIFPALITPFASDESVSLSALKENICLYNETSVAGYVVLGSTGESVMLSREEADSILVAAKEAAAPNKILIAGTGAESTAETIARTKRAAVLGYPVRSRQNSLLLQARLSRRNLYSSLPRRRRRFSHSHPSLFRPAIHRHHPRNSRNPRLSLSIPTSSASKTALETCSASGKSLPDAPPFFEVLTGGVCRHLSVRLVVGARGAVLALAAALPEKCAELYDLFQRGQHESAKQLQLLLVQASKRIVSENGIPGVKYAMDLRGYHGGLPRLPLLLSTETQKRSHRRNRRPTPPRCRPRLKCRQRH